MKLRTLQIRPFQTFQSHGSGHIYFFSAYCKLIYLFRYLKFEIFLPHKTQRKLSPENPMIRIIRFFGQGLTFPNEKARVSPLTSAAALGFSFSRLTASQRSFTTFMEDPELKEFIHYMDSLKNYEKSGIPKGAGTDSDEGFDLGRMRRLMDRLGNPQSRFKV